MSDEHSSGIQKGKWIWMSIFLVPSCKFVAQFFHGGPLTSGGILLLFRMLSEGGRGMEQGCKWREKFTVTHTQVVPPPLTHSELSFQASYLKCIPASDFTRTILQAPGAGRVQSLLPGEAVFTRRTRAVLHAGSTAGRWHPCHRADRSNPSWKLSGSSLLSKTGPNTWVLFYS